MYGGRGMKFIFKKAQKLKEKNIFCFVLQMFISTFSKRLEKCFWFILK